MAVKSKWFGKIRLAEIERNLQKKLELSGQLVEGEAIKNVSGKVVKVRTGKLKDSITHETGKDFVKIGTNVEYAPFVELGTVNQSPRPFLRRALSSSRKKIKTIFSKKMK